jgi:outer membrane protein TolC
MTSFGAVLSLVLVAASGQGNAAADGEPRPWTLEALQAAAQAADPHVLSAAAELARMRGLEEEARAARLPGLEWTLEATGPVPELTNDPDRLDVVKPGSRLRTGDLGSVGVHGHLGANATWPIFTFGKAQAREGAAARATAASSETARAARARAARDAAELYWGYQLTRRRLAALDEADRQLARAHERVEALVAQGSKLVSKQDLAQLELVRAEMASRRAAASAVRDLALDSGRAVVGLPSDAPFTFAAAPLEPPATPIPPLARCVAVALSRRAEIAAAAETVRSREAAALARRRAWYPDLVAIGFVDLNWTGSTTPQTNPFAYDPYNRLWGGLGLALRGALGLGDSHAAAEAEVEKARAELALASRDIRLEVARAHGALRAALERAARTREEEAAGRRWLAQAELSFDAGMSSAQSVISAALATTRAGAERLAAARDAHVALADLGLAMGEDPRNVK